MSKLHKISQSANHSLTGDVLGCLSLFLTLFLLLCFAGALS